jgi:hypothetical protein
MACRTLAPTLPPIPCEKASACASRWADMPGSDRVRFCRGCQSQVFDLSGLDAPEAQRLVTWATGERPGVLFRRSDGTQRTTDCPRGLQVLPLRQRAAQKGRWASVAALLGGLLVLAAATLQRWG